VLPAQTGPQALLFLLPENRTEFQEICIMTLHETPGNEEGADKRSTQSNGLSLLFDWFHRHFLWLLVATYLLAALWPEPGLAMRGFAFRQSGTEEVTVPLLLLALLLFCAASVVQWSQVLNLLQHPGILLLGLGAVWVIPSLFVSFLGRLLPLLLGGEATGGILVGLALVAAMPVANSSVAWTQNARGNVALGLGLIVFSIILSPVATPQMLNLMGLALSEQETAQCEQLVTRFSGAFFIVWVILPSLAGVALNRLVGATRIERARGTIRMISAIALLVLNYTNASLALPQVFTQDFSQVILLSALLAISLQLLGATTAWVMSHSLGLTRESLVSLVFAFSMKHTGLALVLAGEVMQEHPRVILLIVLATLLQHIVAGSADWYLERTRIPHNGNTG